MLPDNCEYHSLEQIALLQRLSAAPSLTSREALFLATQLVNHGFVHAGDFVARLRMKLQSKSAREFLTHLARRHDVIQALPLLRDIQADGEATTQLLKPAGHVFRRGSYRRDTAIVIFTTKFNNFGFSNVVADALFAQLGVSRLYLKDGSDLYYFGGASGLADSLAVLPAAVASLLAAQGIKQTIVTGFSSGGYPSLHVATTAGPLGYVGYAICTDLSAASSLPIPGFYARLRSRVAHDLLTDLKESLAECPDMRCKLFFGERDPVDRAHAAHLIGCPNVELTCHADAGHDITLQILEDRTLLAPFEELLRQT